MYEIEPSYSRRRRIATDDLLEAVKHSMNYEADLFENGNLVVSWLGYNMENNIERLAKKGIETYTVNSMYRFRYLDPDRNTKRIYYTVMEHQNRMGEVHLSSYMGRPDQTHYATPEEVFSEIKKKCPNIRILTVVDFSNDVYDGSYKITLQE